MKFSAKIYIYAVIAIGASVLAASLAGWSGPIRLPWLLYLLLAMVSAAIKLRLPGMDGTFSLNFLFLLFGITHYSLPETLLAGCCGGIVQSLCNTRKRPTLLQTLFNSANFMISGATSFFLARLLLATSLGQYHPAVMSLATVAYFVVNTVLVSGVLTLLQGSTLAETCRQWYVWSFPYYLLGSTLVGLIPSDLHKLRPEVWLILLPLLYLVHFFLGLRNWRATGEGCNTEYQEYFPPAVNLFVGCVGGAGLLLLAATVLHWHSADPARFIVYVALALLAATLKIRLPHMTGTLAVSFVLLLVAVAEFEITEVVAMAMLIGVVQTVWRPRRRPPLPRVLFNSSCLGWSAAVTYATCRWALGAWLGNSLVGMLSVATIVLYFSNTLLVAAALCLASRKSFAGIWQYCYFWSCPYYLVGGTAAGLMIRACRVAGWASSLLILPLMVLVYISYRVHVTDAATQH